MALRAMCGAPWSLVTLSLSLLGCASAAPHAGTVGAHPSVGQESAAATTVSTSSVVGSGPRVPPSFPVVEVNDLPSGMPVFTVVRPAQSIVDIRLVIESGSAFDGEHTGRAAVIARLVADAASQNPSLTTDPKARSVVAFASVDRTVWKTTVLQDAVEPALVAFANALQAPKITALEVKRAGKELGFDDARFVSELPDAGERLIRHDLFLQSIGRHPYATIHATAEDLAKLDAPAVNEAARASLVGGNMALVVVGPVASADVTAMAERAFGHLPKTSARPLDVDDPIERPRPLRIVLVDSPSRASVSITVGRLGPEVADKESVATNLFGEIWSARVATSLSNRARPRFRLSELRQGPSMALFEVDVPASRAKAVLAALLDHRFAGDATTPELDQARASLEDRLALSLEHPGFLADSLARDAALGLDPGSLEKDHVEAMTSSLEQVSSAGRKMVGRDEVAVVIGDAAALASDLDTVGDVDILDPKRDFERVRTARQESATKLPKAAKKGDDSTMEPRPQP